MNLTEGDEQPLVGREAFHVRLALVVDGEGAHLEGVITSNMLRLALVGGVRVQVLTIIAADTSQTTVLSTDGSNSASGSGGVLPSCSAPSLVACIGRG